MFLTKQLWHAYFVAFFVLYVGKGEWSLVKIGIPVDPGLLFGVAVIPAVFLLFGPKYKEIVRAWKGNYLLLGPAFMLSFYYVALSMHPTANLDQYGKYMFAPILNALVFFVAVGLGYALDWDHEIRPYILIAYFCLAASLLTDLFWPGSFGKFDHRAGGLATEPNIAAQSMMIVTSVLLSYYRVRLLDPVILITCYVCALGTLSRSGQVVFVIVLGFYALYHLVAPQATFLRRVTVMMLGVIGAVIMMEAAHEIRETSGIFSDERSAKRFEQLMGNKEMWGPREQRLHLINENLELFMASPIFGHGTAYTKTLLCNTHNEYLRHAVNGGIIGLALFTGWLLVGGLVFIKRGFREGVAFVGVATAVCVFSNTITDDRNFLLLYGILAGESLKRMTFARISAVRRRIEENAAVNRITIKRAHSGDGHVPS